MGVGVGFTKVVSIVVLALFARYLAAVDYGIVTLAFVILGLLAPLRDLGLNQAAVYFRSEEAIGYASTVRALSSCALFVGIAFTLWLDPGLVGGPEPVPVILVIVGTTLLGALSFSSEVRLSRSVRFRELVIAEIIRSSAYSVAAAVLVLLGMGVMGVAFAYLTATGLRTVWLNFCEPIRFTPTLHAAEGASIRSYGASVTVSGLAVLVISNIDSVVILAYLGAGALGYYAMAWNWSTLIALQGAFILHQILFPSFVLLKANPAAMGRGALRAMSLSTLFAFPLSAMLAVSAPEFVRLFLGDAWSPSAGLIPVFALYAAARALIEPLPSAFLAQGHPLFLAKIQVVHGLAITVTAIAAALYFGAVAVAAAVTGMYVVAALFILAGARTRLGIQPKDVARIVVLQGAPALALALAFALALSLFSGSIDLPTLGLLYVLGGCLYLFVTNIATSGQTARDLRFILNAVRKAGITNRAGSPDIAPLE